MTAAPAAYAGRGDEHEKNKAKDRRPTVGGGLSIIIGLFIALSPSSW